MVYFWHLVYISEIESRWETGSYVCPSQLENSRFLFMDNLISEIPIAGKSPGRMLQERMKPTWSDCLTISLRLEDKTRTWGREERDTKMSPLPSHTCPFRFPRDMNGKAADSCSQESRILEKHGLDIRVAKDRKTSRSQLGKASPREHHPLFCQEGNASRES